MSYGRRATTNCKIRVFTNITLELPLHFNTKSKTQSPSLLTVKREGMREGSLFAPLPFCCREQKNASKPHSLLPFCCTAT